MIESHPDRKSYDMIWDVVIQPEINNYIETYDNYIGLIPNAKEEVWDRYALLNKYCKNNYMLNPEQKIDRHKAAACYMVAITVIKPMRFLKKINDAPIPLAINENLAITVGLSIIRAFAISAIKDKCEKGSISQDAADALISRFDKGIQLPDESLVNHGCYLTNFASELRFAEIEGNLCILSLAHELYLLETITRITDINNIKEE